MVRHVAGKHGLSFDLEQNTDTPPLRFAPSMVALVERTVQELGLSNIPMPSGAGHDAKYMSRVCPTAMIFVPSIGGRSHCPEERTRPEDLADGANVLLRCALELAGGYFV